MHTLQGCLETFRILDASVLGDGRRVQFPDQPHHLVSFFPQGAKASLTGQDPGGKSPHTGLHQQNSQQRKWQLSSQLQRVINKQHGENNANSRRSYNNIDDSSNIPFHDFLHPDVSK